MKKPSQARGIKVWRRNLFKKRHPECFFIGGPDPDSPGLPLKARGNDGPPSGNDMNVASCWGINPQRFDVLLQKAEHFPIKGGN
jgi:hypothetical protein